MNQCYLIIGATGFIGTSLVRKLESEAKKIEILARTPDRVQKIQETTKVTKGDLFDASTLEEAVERADVIYYLAHAMKERGENFSLQEEKQATNVAQFLTEKKTLIYLGGIIPDEKLSPHLSSRQRVGEILQGSPARVIEFRASIVVGFGSSSFELIRALVNRLPFLLRANWMESLCQPIVLEDVIDYLFQASLKEFSKKNTIIEIGGPDQMSYFELVHAYIQGAKLLRPIVHVPLFPKDLAKEILNIIAPEYYDVGSKLLESIEHHTIVKSYPPQGFDISLQSVKESLSEIKSYPSFDEMKEVMEKLKKHREIPSYFSGQLLSFSLPLKKSDSDFISSLFSSLQKIYPTIKRDGEGMELRIPFVGEFMLYYREDIEIVSINYKPKFFFNSLGWVIWDTIAKTILKKWQSS